MICRKPQTLTNLNRKEKPNQMNTEKLYKLDWETADISLAKGRFVHTLRRPTPAEILEREKNLQTETAIGKDGSVSLPDPTADEATDAKLYDAICEKTTGYNGDIPERHKSTAFNGLYRREIEVDEDADAFDEEIAVVEEIGGSDEEPDFVVRHIMRQPTEDELKRFRRRMSAGQLKPGKRGRQNYVASSNLKSATDFYRMWAVRIDGIQPLESDFRDFVDPLIQRKVATVFAKFVDDALLD